MGKHRLDEKIRNVLQERSINPSEDSWSRIEEQLGSAPVTKGSNFWKYGIAAGFTGVLFISVILLSTQVDVVLPANEVVNSGNDSEEKTPTITQENSIEIQSEIAVQPKSKTQPVINSREQAEGKFEVAELVQEDQEETQRNVAKEILQLEKLDINIAEVVAQVEVLEGQGVVSDEVIDSLLMQAQAEILKGQAAQAMNKVDALALLADVEEEVNQSLRDQLFEKLKDGYLKVRTAIAYRNE
ncbi:hypothetical protein [Muriicola soli]|uniref:Uncharacterized protein n=1 Tax=Muriicola soli TaxID=2507538 RepID=A0A411E7B5_9FLAO|nr:hypothetical protein [Muriicola soli]QBA63414.1 hypothetical protein EQY75_01930 [Muriicola soli]